MLTCIYYAAHYETTLGFYHLSDRENTAHTMPIAPERGCVSRGNVKNSYRLELAQIFFQSSLYS